MGNGGLRSRDSDERARVSSVSFGSNDATARRFIGRTGSLTLVTSYALRKGGPVYGIWTAGVLLCCVRYQLLVGGSPYTHIEVTAW